MINPLAIILVLMSSVLNLEAGMPSIDSDGDGLADKLEQQLLEKFAPKFMLDMKECDRKPARFQSGITRPKLLSQDGTIYGQVFRIVPNQGSGSFAEIHYYHLWNRDCGRIGHKLDVEHISALIWAGAEPESSSSWRAKYWYAAAHEDTTCDASHAVHSNLISAEEQGPTIWISAGKHASFLSRDLCRGGCGGDKCSEAHALEIAALINLGEPNAPMNESLWIKSTDWPLAEKMQTDFPPQVLEKLDAASIAGFIPINSSQAPVKIAFHVGGDTVAAQSTAARKTGTGLSTTTDAVGASLDKSTAETGNGLKRAARAVWRALGGSRKQDSKSP